MELKTEHTDGALVLAVGGRLDSENARQFEAAAKDAIAGTDPAVVLDLADLAYISSAGLRAVLVVAKELRGRGAKFALCALQDPVREVLQLSGFDKIVDLHDTRPAALAACAA